MRSIQDVGALAFSGRPDKGFIEEISNTETGFKLKLNGLKQILCVDFGSGYLGLDEFEMEKTAEGARYFLPGKDIDIYLEWRKYDSDAALCRFSFKSSNKTFSLKSVKLELPNCVLPSKSGDEEFLVYPKAAGMKIQNPLKEFFVPRQEDRADWKDRQLAVWKRGFGDGSESEKYCLSYNPSMSWLEYYCSEGGIYLASHDPEFNKIELEAEAARSEEGLSLRVIKKFNIETYECRTDFVIGAHSGDWHRGAQIYRAFFNSLGFEIRGTPDFMKESPGMVCHYDFKWQNGDINHHFKKIPEIFSEAEASGIKNILIAGWNLNGFDKSYPEFRPDPNLGSEQDLIESIKLAQAKGGRVFLYVNAYSFDVSSPEFEKYGKKCAVKLEDQSIKKRVWGSVAMAGMCNSSLIWREKVKENVRYVIEALGADGVYIDQLSVLPEICCDKEHDHKESWIKNNLRMINEIRNELGPSYDGKIFLFSEWLTDLLAVELNAQLVHTCWMGGLKYAFPEMFKYAFPEAPMLDQVQQKPWEGNPRWVEGSHTKDVICRMFINGILFWVYDHLLENPDIRDFLKNAFQLRKRLGTYFDKGRFMDDDLVENVPDGVAVKSYDLPDGNCFFCVWNKTNEKGAFYVKNAVSGSQVEVFDFSGKISSKAKETLRSLEFPQTELSVIVIK